MELEKIIFQKIKSATKVLVVTHYNPDGDAMSSLSAFSEILEHLDKPFTAYCKGPIEASLRFLPQVDLVQEDITAIDFASHDLIISLDCGSVERTGIASIILNRAPNQTFIEIDHHPKVETVSDIELRLSEAAATTEIIYGFCRLNGIRISATLATCILTGLATDTGSFIYPCTNRRSIAIAAEMLWRGARLPTIIKETFYRQNVAALKIWGLAMSRLTINEHYQIAFTALTYQDYKELGADESMTDELAGWLACLDGVKAVLFLKEAKPGLIKGSWRAVDPDFNVARLAIAMGGGGHVKAAGFALKGTLKHLSSGWTVE